MTPLGSLGGIQDTMSVVLDLIGDVTVRFLILSDGTTYTNKVNV